MTRESEILEYTYIYISRLPADDTRPKLNWFRHHNDSRALSIDDQLLAFDMSICFPEFGVIIWLRFGSELRSRPHISAESEAQRLIRERAALQISACTNAVINLGIRLRYNWIQLHWGKLVRTTIAIHDWNEIYVILDEIHKTDHSGSLWNISFIF